MLRSWNSQVVSYCSTFSLHFSILKSSGLLAQEDKKNKRRKMAKVAIVPRHVLLTVRNDPDLDALLKGVVFQGAGGVPHIRRGLQEDESSQSEEEEERL